MIRGLLIIALLVGHLTIAWSQQYTETFYNKNATAILKTVQKKYGLKVSYDPIKLKQYKISGRFEGSNVENLLDDILSDIPFNLKKAGSVFLIVPSKSTKIIKGSVTDASNGQPLPSALIKTGPQKGTTSSQSGTFRIEDPRDSVEMTISYLGYKTITLKTTKEDFEIKLEPDTSVLQPFILHADNHFENLLYAGHLQINTSQVTSLPSLGEPDIFKSLQLLPGISATDETSSGLYVRGGTPEQNLVLMDGFTIYHLDHFFGIYSSFNPYMVDRIDVYKGGFSSNYGGRISSVVDTKGRVGNYNDFHGGVSLTSTSLNTYLEGPLGNRVSAIGSVRASHQGLVNNGIYNRFIKKNRVNIFDASDPYYADESPQLEPNLQFYDLNGKIRYRINDYDFIDLNLYISGDEYSGELIEEDEFESFHILDKAEWGNIGTSINYSLFKSNEVQHNFSISGSAYSSSSQLSSRSEFWLIDENIDSLRADLEVFDEFSIEDDSVLVYQFGFNKTNEVIDMSLKWERTQELTEGQNLTLGIELNSLTSSYEFRERDEPEDLFEQYAWVTSGYGQYHFAVGALKPSIGLRVNHYSPSENWQIEPRMSVAYKLSQNITSKAAWSIHHQYFNRFSLSPFGNNDQYFWILADDFEDSYPVLRSEHFILGGIYQRNGWTVDVEGYYKYSTGILESDFVLFNPSGLDIDFEEEYVLHGENISTGLDLLIKKTTDMFTSWISYNLGWSENSFPTINNGAWYPSLYDQRHEVNWVNMLKVGKWDFSSTFIYGSGRPFTPAGEFEEDLYDISRINSQRLPSYHRMDLAATRHLQFKNSSMDVGITLFNLYNRKNLRSKRFIPVFDFEDDEEIEFIPLNINLLGFTPNFYLSYKF